MYFLGIDIQTRRDCSYAVINDTSRLVKSGWISDPISIAAELVMDLERSSNVAVGIEAPRMPLTSQRKWYWSGGKKTTMDPPEGSGWKWATL